MNYNSLRHRQQKNDVARDDTVVHDRGSSGDLTQVNYPPFFPLGDTQSIYKK